MYPAATLEQEVKCLVPAAGCVRSKVASTAGRAGTGLRKPSRPGGVFEPHAGSGSRTGPGVHLLTPAQKQTTSCPSNSSGLRTLPVPQHVEGSMTGSLRCSLTFLKSRSDVLVKFFVGLRYFSSSGFSWWNPVLLRVAGSWRRSRPWVL